MYIGPWTVRTPSLFFSHPSIHCFIHAPLPSAPSTSPFLQLTTHSNHRQMARTSAISGTQRSRHDDSAVAVPVASAMVTLSSSSSHHRRLSLTNLDNTEKESALQDQQEDTHPLPRPPPPSKSFYNAENTIPYSYTPFDTFKSEPPSRVGTFFSRSRPKRTATSRTLPSIWIDRFFARHPSLERHRRLVGALVFTICILLLLLIILLAILLSHKGSGNGNGGYGGGGSGSGSGSGSGGSGGGYGDGPTTSDSDLAKHNQGIPRPPINHSNATGWKSSGQGDGTFYGENCPPKKEARRETRLHTYNTLTCLSNP